MLYLANSILGAIAPWFDPPITVHNVIIEEETLKKNHKSSCMHWNEWKKNDCFFLWKSHATGTLLWKQRINTRINRSLFDRRT